MFCFFSKNKIISWIRQELNLFLRIFSPAHRPTLLLILFESDVRIERTLLVLQTNTYPLGLSDINKKTACVIASGLKFLVYYILLNRFLPLAFVGKAAETKTIFSNCHVAKICFIFEFRFKKTF